MTPQLLEVFKVNIIQANEAHAKVGEIANVRGEVGDADKMMMLTEMGNAVRTRDSAVCVIKRNIPRVGHADVQSIKRVLNPEVYQMLLA